MIGLSSSSLPAVKEVNQFRWSPAGHMAFYNIDLDPVENCTFQSLGALKITNQMRKLRRNIILKSVKLIFSRTSNEIYLSRFRDATRINYIKKASCLTRWFPVKKYIKNSVKEKKKNKSSQKLFFSSQPMKLHLLVALYLWKKRPPFYLFCVVLLRWATTSEGFVSTLLQFFFLLCSALFVQ